MKALREAPQDTQHSSLITRYVFLGPVAQWESRWLITTWSEVRSLPGPCFLSRGIEGNFLDCESGGLPEKAVPSAEQGVYNNKFGFPQMDLACGRGAVWPVPVLFLFGGA